MGVVNWYHGWVAEAGGPVSELHSHATNKVIHKKKLEVFLGMPVTFVLKKTVDEREVSTTG